ncbi:DUF4085 family protein [Desulfotomaculum sp. 1211_IL3151]|uniref:DUF4085 family protein n=1 Tax=Desulfotomaculum sp. 1211_IL3151 TaxID=3084055 RepID=UPI002FDAE266
MKYLTKEWYELCQRTGLHFGMKVHKGANVYDEALYLRLYKRKEKEFVKLQHEIYHVDPRFMLEQDGCTLVPLDKFANGGEINEGDKVVYRMSSEEKDRIQKLIAEYDVRPPFDEKKCRAEFRSIQETVKKETVDKLPHELYQQIADVRVFSLGYCTKEILSQLKSLSKENEKKMNRILNEYSKAQQGERIPQMIRERFGFHDCEVIEFTVRKKDVVMRLDTRGGFTNFNMITFAASEIIKQEDYIVGSTWLYEELYRTENGYEAHILFAGEGMPELVIRCKDIIVNEK